MRIDSLPHVQIDAQSNVIEDIAAQLPSVAQKKWQNSRYRNDRGEENEKAEDINVPLATEAI